MSRTIAIAVSEFHRYRHLLVAAAAAAALPLLISLIPGMLQIPPQELREVAAAAVSTIFALVFSLLLGSSFIARDLAEGRLSFYFALPVSGSTIWFGRLLGLYSMLVACELIIIAPTTALNMTVTETLVDPSLWTIVLLSPLVVLLASHTVSVIIRARSPWIAADVVAGVLVTVIGWTAVSPLLASGSEVPASFVLRLLAVAVLIALVASPAVQLAVGRTDSRRSHKALSVTLWSVLLCGSLTALAYSTWVRSAAPGDLTSVERISSAPQGDWFVTLGQAWGRGDYFPMFLVNAQSGEYVRLGASSYYIRVRAKLAADGAHAIVLQPASNHPSTQCWVNRYYLKNSGVHRSSTLLDVPYGSRWACSADASRIAYLHNGLLTVYDFTQEKDVLSAKVGKIRGPLCFVDNDTVRLYSRIEDANQFVRLEITTADVGSHRVAQTGELTPPLRRLPISHGGVMLDSSSTTMLFAWSGGSHDPQEVSFHLSVRDAATGAIVSEIDPALLGDARTACWTQDRRVLVVAVKHDQAVLRIIDPAGTVIREIAVGPASWVAFGQQPATDRVLIQLGVRGDDGGPGTITTYDVNLISRSVVPLEGLRIPWGSQNRIFGFIPSISTHPPGSLASRLFLTEDQQLMYRDPVTGELRHLLGKGDG